jgi:peptidyl-tRNA hydrolase, PTH1 family
MVRLVVGLGNPGRQYEKTRHNVGFLFLDALALERSSCWAKANGVKAMVAELNIQGNKVILLKPQAFMNLSGQPVGQVARYFKLAVEEILVVHDELDFNAGVIKLKKNGGHAGHNGLRSIISHLGSNDFYRLRIGIGRPSSREAVADYVLSEPPKDDLRLFDLAINRGIVFFDQIVSGGATEAMSKINT